MKFKLAFLLLLSSLTLVAQVEIAPQHYHLQVTDTLNDFRETKSFTLPYFPANEDDPAFDQIHTELRKLTQELQFQQGEGSFAYPADRDSNDYYHVTTTNKFQVETNSKDWLSFYVIMYYSADFPNGFSATNKVHAYNVSLAGETPELITLDALIPEDSRDKILSLVGEPELHTWDDGWTRVAVVTVNEKYLVLHSEEHRGRVLVHNAWEIPLKDALPLLNPEFQKLLQSKR